MTRHHYLLLLVVSISLVGCSTQPAAQQSPTTPLTTTEVSPMSTDTIVRRYAEAPGKLADEKIQNKQVVIETNKGSITFELFADEAPLTVSNFVFLTERNFYDGLTFHRYEPGFVIQGGDPNGNGTGGPGYRFADEPVSRTYERGIVAMANAGPDTNGSQFFIMLENTPLPPNYTIFGKVTDGMDVVDQIRAGDTMTSVTVSDKSQA